MISKVIGKNLNVSGKTTPIDFWNIIPSSIAKLAIKVLPKNQLEKLGFSHAVKKYGATSIIKSVANRKMLSKLNLENVLPNSIAKKKSTKVVSTAKLFSPVVSFRFLSKLDVSRINLSRL